MNNKVERLVFYCFFLAQLLFVSYYLLINIKNIGNGNGIGITYIILFYIVSLIIVWYQFLRHNLLVRYSFLLMLLLWCWIAYRVMFDIGSLEYLKQLMLATTGGVVFFYFLGFSLSVTLSDLCRRFFCIKYKTTAFDGVMLCVFLLLIVGFIDLFFNFQSRLRSDIFLIQGVNGQYQRAGSFLSILFLITSYLYLILRVQGPYLLGKNKSVISYILFFFYLLVIFLSIITAQMMGSNNTFVVILGIGLITLVVSGVVILPKNVRNYFILKSKIINKHILVTFTCRIAFLLAFLLAFSIGLIIVFNFDINLTRFVGYGDQVNTSISSRLDIIKYNFVIQFSDSPIFGNYNVDAETTGIGTYVHSFFLHALTHTGLIGFIGFICFFSMLFYSLLKSDSLFSSNKRILSVEKPLRLYSVMVLIFLLIVANVGTVVTWPVLWFGIGFFGQLLNFKNKVYNE